MRGSWKKNGYRTLNIGYPSTRMTIEDSAQHIHEAVSAFAREVPKLHFAGFSMGSLLIRAYLHRFRPGNLGRIVMLGPPNHGSEMADYGKDWWIYRRFYGPAGQQLVTHYQRADEIFGKVDYELGIIAGDLSLDFIANRIIGKPNDGKVSIESTRLEDMRDHIVIRANHTFFFYNKLALRQTLNFLRTGSFSRP